MAWKPQHTYIVSTADDWGSTYALIVLSAAMGSNTS